MIFKMKHIFISSCQEEDYTLFEKTLRTRKIEYDIDSDRCYVVQDKDAEEVTKILQKEMPFMSCIL